MAEVGYALTSLGEKLSEEEVDQMVRHADVDGEGRFNIAELNGRRLTYENILCIS